MNRRILALADPPGKLTKRNTPILKNYRLQHGYNLIKRKNSLSDLSFDPITIGTAIAGIYTAAQKLFGNNRTRLTSQDWLTIIPGSGFWHDKLRNYMSLHIQYNTDLGNIEPFTAYFADENQISISDLNSQLQKESPTTTTAGFDLGNSPLLLIGGILVAGLIFSNTKKGGSRKWNR